MTIEHCSDLQEYTQRPEQVLGSLTSSQDGIGLSITSWQ